MCVFFFFLDGGGWKGKECVPAQEVFYRNLCNVKKKKAEIQHPFRHSIQQGVVTRGARNGRHVRRPAQFCNR